MSTNGNRIVCRKCQESISLDNDSCPNCGASVRGTLPYVVGIVLGLVLVGAAIVNISDLLAYGVVGLFVAGSAGYLLYEKRQRVEQAGGESRTFEG